MWRFYARRPHGGEWLSTDVPLQASITDELSGPGSVVGIIPAALDVPTGEDGLPMWLERGTLLYAEQDKRLAWHGVCTYTTPTPQGRQLECAGIHGALSWAPYDDVFRAWHPDPFDVVQAMLDHAQGYPNGNLGLTLERVNAARRGVGDEQPPTTRPVKPGRKAGESRDDYDDRLLSWEMDVDEWERKYGGREKYLLAWWEAPMIGDELDELAREVPFDYRTRHRWTDRDNLTAEHVLEVGGQLGARRHDIELVQGVNLAANVEPETDLDGYADDVIVLGAGEGREMRRARVSSVQPGRLRSGAFRNAKHVRNLARLRSIAQREHTLSTQAVAAVPSARVTDVSGYAPVATLRPGDEVWVKAYEPAPFAGWQRVTSVTRSTENHVCELRFEAGVL